MFKEIVLIALVCVYYTQAGTVEIGIVHYNDIYGQLQKFKSGTKPPVVCGKNEQKCSGGLAELMGHIKKIEEEDFAQIQPDSKLRFAAGNLISGENGWIRLLDDGYRSDGWKQYGELLAADAYYTNFRNYYSPNATALGPRDFDGGLEKLNNYVSAMKGIKPVVSNMDCRLIGSSESVDATQEQNFCSNSSQMYQIISSSSIKIGVVGYVDPIVHHQSEPGKLAFQDTVTSLKQTVSSLLSQNNDVKVIFAIGTGSLERAKSIIDEIPQIKLIVYGGGKNSDISDEDYPLKYKSSYIVTAHKYGETLGKLMLKIDDTTGNILSVAGSERVKNDYSNPIEINTSVESKVARMAETVGNDKYTKAIGGTKVKLVGSVSECWKKECALGDLITDSMVHCAFNKPEFDSPAELISLWHSSGISGSVKSSDSEINILDVHKWMAYNNMATVVSMKGNLLRQMFSASAQSLAAESQSPNWGQFLQVSSGVQVSYNIFNSTTVQTEVRIAKLNNEGQLLFQQLDDKQIYWVVLPSFLYNGRNVYHFLPQKFELIGNSNADKVDIDMDYKCMENYVKAMGMIQLGYEQRIIVNDPNEIRTTTSTESTGTSTDTTGKPNPTTTTHSPILPPIQYQGDSYSKLEVATISSASTLLVVAVLIGALFIFMRHRRPRVQHKKFESKFDSFSSTDSA